ncbi:MAG TPA: MBL fold metallo-hydrolase [Methylomusa anaerophila]|uniref:Metal-dependent hydrolase n=1 Tax=Methylomusa anaerophila TaxID=1930071 RepID=A0A348AF21_9FIRM|nr:MBL fold metallo-hydrolase [Methylomusa anaerophila]BBB89669.1 metal-dependent hydrolase [Methylomusa anaerophila]HML89554.1 MBL fold metallo-hydrolase [Methylomusa anaerophila]
MQLEWKGHASFLLHGDKGVKVLTDPFDEKVGYPLPNVEVDAVTVSHQHGDHNATGLLPGKPIIVEGAGKHLAAGIEIRGIATYHDAEQGAKRGNNTIFVISLDELNICHLGDLGHPLTPEQVAEIGPVDVLLTPVGGFYTIDARQAYETVQQLKPAVVLPMHYKLDDRLKYPIATVDEFLHFYSKVEKQAVLKLDKSTLPKELQVVVLELR